MACVCFITTLRREGYAFGFVTKQDACFLRCWLSDSSVQVTEKPVRKRVRELKPLIASQRERNQMLEKKALDMKLDWRIVASTVLHRYPTLLRELEPWEKDFQRVQDKIEDRKREALVKKLEGTSSQLLDSENPSYEDILKTLPFTPASRITEADLSNNRRSLDRKLDMSLYLIVKRNRGDHSWQFPQGKIGDTETLRQASERVIDRAIGKTNRWFMSNGPIAYYCYEYPPDIKAQRKQFGAKVFFVRSQLIDGHIKLETKLYKDYAWMAREEVAEYFDPSMAEMIDGMLPF